MKRRPPLGREPNLGRSEPPAAPEFALRAVRSCVLPAAPRFAPRAPSRCASLAAQLAVSLDDPRKPALWRLRLRAQVVGRQDLSTNRPAHATGAPIGRWQAPLHVASSPCCQRLHLLMCCQQCATRPTLRQRPPPIRARLQQRRHQRHQRHHLHQRLQLARNGSRLLQIHPRLGPAAAASSVFSDTLSSPGPIVGRRTYSSKEARRT